MQTRIDVYETLYPQQMLVHKGGKIKNWGGECRDVTPTNCSLKIYIKRALGGGGVGLGGQGRCEQRSEVFVKNKKKMGGGFRSGGGGGGGGGVWGGSRWM